MSAPFETFPALSTLPWLRHGFIQRVQGIDVRADRPTVMPRLENIHRQTLSALGIQGKTLITAEQIHGLQVATVHVGSVCPVPGVDGLITNDPGVCLGIHVADCGAIYLVDRKTKAIGLLHSGKKGSELGILSEGIRRMGEKFGTDPADLVVQLGPCIRAPHYEIDFPAQIRAQATAAGVGEYHDCGTCTAADPERYYSYRREKGMTGRLLALLAVVE